ncbi:penicillin-binding protein 2 [Teredinibacter turnerae]|uniref:Peptidoglycan D,D-transpeptidase MrdA n=1 Tax=Teredinibacter turnerae (strain ATCC 39867 / T7901) TaxID=377629 RepID=C5BNN3_TERTT|nr:penicillin-binding protein 2 [Teredinibacter turnerae]ACR10805.1 penicillin-binding protein 2 [Teredinibacter turnerae T7901]
MMWAGEQLHQFKDHHREARVFAVRAAISFLMVVALFGVLLARYYRLQVTDHEVYATRSDRNRIHVRPIPPNRGLIYDAQGQLLADNRPTFTLSVVSERTSNLEQTLDHLANLIEVSERDRENFLKRLRQRRRPFEAVPLRYRLTEEEISRIAVNEFELEGVEIEAQLTRAYPKGALFAHTVGYVGRINERELSSFDQATYERYSGTHSIGKIGLERYYESELLGQVGSENIETNAHGRVLRTLEFTDPQPGKDLYLFLDSRLQQVAVDQLAGRRGSVVAIDVKTGGVLAMVSAPAYDPNLFVNGISYKDYRALNESRDLPLFNRSIQGQYPPGSTIKPMLGLGGLEAGVVDFDTHIFDPGYYQLENDERLYRDWKKGGHGRRVDLRQAIVESCDTFFYDMAFRMGVDSMHPFGDKFGLGERTRLDIPSERPGLWPSREWKERVRGLHWFPGDSLNISIGQGDVLTTPLQLAVMTATIASRGTHLRPRLVKQLGDQPTEREVVDQIEVQPQYWDYVHSAMEGVVHSARGTAHRISRGIGYKMAGKSGTAQVVGIAQDEEYDADKLDERQWDHALFIGFAPVEDPQIAVAIIVENGEHGSSAAGPIAREVFDTYFAMQAEDNAKP